MHDVAPKIPCVTVAAVLLLASSCVSPGGGESAPNESAQADTVVRAGEPAMLISGTDTTPNVLPVLVRRSDGSAVFAIFRGPRALAGGVTKGTFEFHADSLNSRVRVLEAGERLRRTPGGDG